MKIIFSILTLCVPLLLSAVEFTNVPLTTATLSPSNSYFLVQTSATRVARAPLSSIQSQVWSNSAGDAVLRTGTTNVAIGTLSADYSPGAWNLSVGDDVVRSGRSVTLGHFGSSSDSTFTNFADVSFECDTSTNSATALSLLTASALTSAHSGDFKVHLNGANTNDSYILFRTDTKTMLYVDAFSVEGKAFTVTGLTNQIIFGKTNTAPVSTAAPTKWISVRVTGESTVYRLPLYQ